jgi:site-specific DNA recombinase
VPAIVDQDTFERAQRVSRDNSKWNPRGAEPGAWLLRGLVECGHCGVGVNCHKMRGRNGAFHRYYYCRNHDVLRAGGHDRRCPERNIRANELDGFVFDQVRAALLDPRQLIAGEHAVIGAAPPDENELIAAQLRHLESALEATERERSRMLDAYQAGLLELDELSRRTTALTARRHQLTQEKNRLAQRSAELASQNRLRRGLAGFAERVAASLDELDFDARQRLLRLVVEKVRVQGWHVEIHLKIPLQDDDGDDGGKPTPPPVTSGPSSDVRLRSLGAPSGRVVSPARGAQARHTRPIGPDSVDRSVAAPASRASDRLPVARICRRTPKSTRSGPERARPRRAAAELRRPTGRSVPPLPLPQSPDPPVGNYLATSGDSCWPLT